MTYEPKNYTHLLGMNGFSDDLLKNHFALYEGYVKNTNTLQEKIQGFIGETSPTAERAELQRRFGWEYNGMRLHELYFENLTRDKTNAPSSELIHSIENHFGSFEKWKNDFSQIGLMRGIGWVLLVQDDEGALRNIWINEHDVGLLALHTPLLVMDVFEHSYMLDYHLKRSPYIDAFLAHIDWEVIDKRHHVHMLTKGKI
jgi:Fe-Mn family superoxide dismutase